MRQTRPISRRSFMRIIGAGSVAGLVALKVGGVGQTQAATVSDTRILMGTVINLSLVSNDESAARRAINDCFWRMAALEDVLSRHDPNSQLSQLNRDGQLAEANPGLLHILTEALALSEATGGAFDVTMKPLLDLYQRAAADGALPDDVGVQRTLAHVGYHGLRLSGKRVAFGRPGMGVTLDGIAKGYIVDQGTGVLRERGFDNVMVEAGGDLSAYGTNASDDPWRVGIQNPRRANALVNSVTVRNGAVATSGDYMQPYTADMSAHHIVDPRTGYSKGEVASATVQAPTGLQADALATTLMVMGLEQGKAFVTRLPGVAVTLIDKAQRVHHASGAEAR